MGLVMEQIRNIVSGLIALPVSRSAIPCGLNHTTWPRRATNVTAPAIRFSWMLRWTAVPIRSSRSDDSPTVSGLATGRSCATATPVITSMQLSNRRSSLRLIAGCSLYFSLNFEYGLYKRGSFSSIFGATRTRQTAERLVSRHWRPIHFAFSAKRVGVALDLPAQFIAGMQRFAYPEHKQ